MKYSLCILTLCGLVAFSPTGFAQETQAPSGQELVAQAAVLAARQPGVEARLRHRVDLFGQQLVGVGTYLQSRGRPESLVRLELKVQVGEQLQSLQHVCDGRFLWIRRDTLERPSLSRIDLRRVREALANSDSPEVSGSLAGLAACGLPKLLQGLERNFEFGTPRAQTIGDFPVWEVRGVWKPVPGSSGPTAREGATGSRTPLRRDESVGATGPQLTPISTTGPAPVAALPGPAADPNWRHVPDEVILVLGRDELIPLFPYRIDFRRRPTESEGEAGPGKGRGTKSMLVLELFEVRRRPDLEPRHFSFQVGDQPVEDHTDAYLRSLGLVRPRPEP